MSGLGELMRRRELEQLSPEALLDLADEHDIDSAEQLSRETLVELLIEAFEEERLELQAQDNNPVTVEEKKYTRFSDRPISQGEADIELVESYNDTRLVFLLRDPSWAYAYWDLRSSIEQEIQESDGDKELMLRVFELDSVQANTEAALGSFDIPVRATDREWYVNIPTQERAYRAELVQRSSQSDRVLAVSNSLSVPRGGMFDSDANGNSSSVDKILALSGLQKLDVAGAKQAIPQRVISLIDEHV